MKRGARRLTVAASASFVVIACSSASAPTASGPNDGGITGGDANAPLGSDASFNDAPVTDAPIVDGSRDASDAPLGCGEFAGDANFTCSKDGNSRGKCVDDASLDDEACPNGCLIEPAGQDSICMGTTDTWSCAGSYGTIPSQDGNYYLSSFGCWVDTDGGTHTDPGDNCIPGCLSQAKAAGLCLCEATDTGPECENRVNWFTADGARFGCLQRLRVTNPANGKALIAVALDFGPACAGEATVQHAVLDSSGAIDAYLFGGPEGVVGQGGRSRGRSGRLDAARAR